MKFRVVDPTGRPRQATDVTQPAPRLRQLEGARLGVLLNERGSALVTNWPAISLELQELLQRKYGAEVVAREFKPLMSAPASADLLARFARGSDGVVNGLGK